MKVEVKYVVVALHVPEAILPMKRCTTAQRPSFCSNVLSTVRHRVGGERSSCLIHRLFDIVAGHEVLKLHRGVRRETIYLERRVGAS